MQNSEPSYVADDDTFWWPLCLPSFNIT